MGVVSLARSLARLLSDKAHGDDDDGERKAFTAKLRPFLVSFAYMFQGGRMALGAWTLFSMGHLKKEMQRYMYQRRRWAAAGIAEVGIRSGHEEAGAAWKGL